MAAPSLGHYASLSFVVIVRGQMTGGLLENKRKRKLVKQINFYRLLLTVYRLRFDEFSNLLLTPVS